MFLKQSYWVSDEEESKQRLDFYLADQSRLLTARFLTAARSKHRLDF